MGVFAEVEARDEETGTPIVMTGLVKTVSIGCLQLP